MDFSMPLDEAMRTQRAIRRLKPDPVEDVLILQLIDLAIRAPTGSNAQNWEFIVVKDSKVKEKLARFNRQAWGLAVKVYRRKAQTDPRKEKMRAAVQWQTDHFEEIPVFVVACLKGRYLPFVHLSTTSYFGLNLSGGAEPAAGSAGRGPGRRSDYHPAVEYVCRAQGARPALERHPLRFDPAGLAAWTLRPDDAQTCARGGPP